MRIIKYLGKITRQLNLAGSIDNLRFLYFFLKNYKKNKKAQQSFPGFNFPPAYFMYETYQLNYRAYYSDGLQTAAEIIQLFSQHINFELYPKSILDWGCGPGRIVRHLPRMLTPGCKIQACDYNAKYINWCSYNIDDVYFSRNNLQPPTPFESNSLDAIYGLSIITHLSADSHYKWIRELFRILKPGSLLMITSQGDAFKEKLLPDEQVPFNQGKLVVRESKNEGHRIYSAFQPASFMKELLQEFTLLKFIPGGSKESILGLQDTWLVQKRLS